MSEINDHTIANAKYPQILHNIDNDIIDTNSNVNVPNNHYLPTPIPITAITRTKY